MITFSNFHGSAEVGARVCDPQQPREVECSKDFTGVPAERSAAVSADQPQQHPTQFSRRISSRAGADGTLLRVVTQERWLGRKTVPSGWHEVTDPRSATRAGARAFTLVEILIVLGIICLVMVIGIPTLYQAVHPDSMRKAVADVMEACSQARAQAIIRGIPTELRIDPIEGTLAVGVAPPRKSFDSDASVRSDLRPVAAAGGSFFHARLSHRMSIEMLDVNFQEFKESEEGARVVFYPNGTSDEFTIVLKSDQGEWRKISLEVTTALADIEIIR